MSEVLLLLGGGLVGVAWLVMLSRVPGPVGGELVAIGIPPSAVGRHTLMSVDGYRTARGGRGPAERHLMVGLRLRAERVRVSSVAVAPGRPPQLLASQHPWLAAVVREGEIIHLSRVPDPFAWSGHPAQTGRTGAGGDEGRTVVAIPFRTPGDLTDTVVHVLPLDDRERQVDPRRLGREVRRRLDADDSVRSLAFDAVQASPQWSTVGPLVGLPVDPARFEVYRDADGQWRWRMRRVGGSVVAVASTGHASRSGAEAELAWLRGHAAEASTTILE